MCSDLAAQPNYITFEQARNFGSDTRRCRGRPAALGLNWGQAHLALKNALRIGRQGEIRDRTSPARNFGIAGLNLLMAIIIYRNTEKLTDVLLRIDSHPASPVDELTPRRWKTPFADSPMTSDVAAVTAGRLHAAAKGAE